MRTAAILALLGIATLGLGQQPVPEAPPRILADPSTIPVHIPEFMWWGDIQCDESGSIYYQLETGSANNATLLRVAANGQESTVYVLPKDTPDGGTNYYEGFSITPSGVVRVIYLTEKTGNLYIAEFSKDGALTNETRLASPDFIKARYFAAFEDGTAWLNAYYGARAPEATRGKRYAAIFDPSGKVVKQMDAFMPNVHIGDSSSKSAEGNVALGKDGNLYFLTDKDVVVISHSGEVLRRVKYSKTSLDQIATDIRVSNGLLAITLTVIEKHIPHNRFLLIDSLTGQTYGSYELTGPQKMLLCFDRQEGFTFEGSDKSGRVFEHYALH